VDDGFPNYISEDVPLKGCAKQHTSTFAAIRNVATAISCKFFCVTNPLFSVVDAIDC
jgi:hypothetical protein